MVSYRLTSFLSALSSFIFFTVVIELMIFITELDIRLMCITEKV